LTSWTLLVMDVNTNMLSFEKRCVIVNLRITVIRLVRVECARKIGMQSS